jgi:hypothetical protein
MPFWLPLTASGWKGVACPVHGFVGRNAKISAKAHAFFLAGENAMKKKNPGRQPRHSQPSTLIDRLAYDLSHQTIPPAKKEPDVVAS